jgi:two-component system, NarL family, sensor histidine kinase UhpB
MCLPFRSLRVRLVAFPLALLAFWLTLVLVGAIYEARARLAAEVKASSALAAALIEAVSANGMDSAAILHEAEKHLPPTRHVLLGTTVSRDPATIREIAGQHQMGWNAPSWFVGFIAPERPVHLVKVGPESENAEWIYIIPNPADEIREVWQDFCFIAAFCTVLVIVIAGSSLWMARKVLHPIRVLGEGLESLERDEFQTSLGPIRFSELEKIEAQFTSLARSLKEKTSENQRLYKELISTQERERRHVARELHDELGPCLFGIRAEVASILQNLEHAPRDVFIAVRARAIDALTGTVQQINRRILHTLQPAVLSEKGLAAALRDLTDGWQTAYPAISWSLDFAEGDLTALPEEAALAIFRMIQEGLTNIVRHSGCSEACVVISRTSNASGETIGVLIKDDGRGFDLPLRRGGGLQGMEERIRKLGGDFILRRECGQGAAVEASIPIPPAVAA